MNNKYQRVFNHNLKKINHGIYKDKNNNKKKQ